MAALDGWDLDAVRAALRAAGARFALLHGSRVTGGARDGSDLDVAAWFGGDPGEWWGIALPARVDLTPLDTAPLELAGRVALHGRLLFDDDPAARVRWQADTRLRYLDEQFRQREVNRVFLEAQVSRWLERERARGSPQQQRADPA